MKDLVVKFNQDSSLQKIKAAYIDDSVKLTESEEKLLEQLRYLFSLRLKNKFAKQQAIEKFINEYKINKTILYMMIMIPLGKLYEVDRIAEKTKNY